MSGALIGFPHIFLFCIVYLSVSIVLSICFWVDRCPVTPHLYFWFVCKRSENLNHRFIFNLVQFSSFSMLGGSFPLHWTSPTFVTRWRFQAVLWWLNATWSTHGTTALPWSHKPHTNHQTQHHSPSPTTPSNAYPAHAESSRVNMFVFVSADCMGQSSACLLIE